MTSRRHEFTAEETADLLDELGARLQRRGVAASILWWAVRRLRPTT
jgi:hypothetical protein